MSAPAATSAAVQPELLERARAAAAVELGRLAGDGEPVAPARRLRQFLQVATAGLAAVFGGGPELDRYLLYHRDWVLRRLVLGARRGPAKAAELLAVFEQQAAAWRPDGLDLLARGLVRIPAEGTSAWAAALAELARSAASGPLGDPFAAAPADTWLLKALHGVACEAGLRRIDEAFAFHLLRLARGEKAGEEAGAGSCQLLPPPLAEAFDGAPCAGEPDSEAFDWENLYLWQALTAATGAEGRAWARLYQEKVAPVAPAIKESVTLARQRRIEDGRRLLSRAEAGLARLRREEPISGAVMTRFYFGSLSYFRFLDGDLEGADRALDDAGEAVAAAVAGAPFLVAFSTVAIDIPLKKARLAKELGRWEEMHAQLRVVFEMLLGRRPLVASGERTVSLGDVAAAFAHLPEEGELAPSLQVLREPRRRRRFFLDLAGDFYRQLRLFAD